MTNNITPFAPETTLHHDGYDIPVYGLDNGQFYAIHIPAIVCIVASFTSVIVAIVMSFQRKNYRVFFTKWSKSERFVVYLAICDGLYNVFHFTDHMHIIIVHDHVYPKELCTFYGFTLVLAISSQNFMVFVVAINGFMLMYFDRSLRLGKYDWKLLISTYGIAILGATVSASFGQLGPNGAFCYFDGINGKIAKTFFTTIVILFVIFVNTILYALTCRRIYSQISDIKKTLHAMPATMKASHKAAKTMSLFVAAFFIQWWSLGLYGVWDLVDEENVPQPVFHLVTTFTNIGGVLNLIVLLIIRRKQSHGVGSQSTIRNGHRNTVISRASFDSIKSETVSTNVP